MLGSQRELFDIPRDVAYLNCAYMSPLLRSSVAAGREAFSRKLHPWTTTPPDFFRDMEEARLLFGQLIGASSDDVALIPATSYGLAVAAQNLPIGPGERVLLLDGSFPSMVYTWQARALEVGAEVILLPRPADHDWTRAILEAIDQRVRVAVLPVCHWTDGALLDLSRIATRLREVAATLTVDATQSLGVMPFDLQMVQPDFMVCATYKWLLGPYSMGFLYSAPRWQDGKPIEHNWIAREGSQDFSGLTQYRDTYQPGSRRYDVGEPSNFVLLPVVIDGLRQLLGWGIESLYDTASQLASRIAKEAEPFGYRAVPASLRAGHYLGLRRDGGVPDGLGAHLASTGVYISVRGTALRVTPHVYNDNEDVDRLIEALETFEG